MGHIDHGKTELARVLSDRVSTAGLDKHPQSKARGITIDLGFTMFELGDYLVTLVDAPGHADLIRSVVAGANIIDTGIVVVAADEGPKVQTGEHIVVLQSLGVENVLAVITKTDLVSEKKVSEVERHVRSILSEAGFGRVESVTVSAKDGIGIDDLKTRLLSVLHPRPRDNVSPLLMPIDHAFPVKGHGTVATGTLLKGTMSVGEKVQIVPLGKTAKVRSIQTFGEARDRASAGDRVGVNIPEVQHQDLSRGHYLCAPGSLQQADCLVVDLTKNPLYRGRLTHRLVVSASAGMATVTAMVVPLRFENEKKLVLDEMRERRGKIGLVLKEAVPANPGTRVLLLRTDLAPTRMRIIGAGPVAEIPETLMVHRRKTRIGRVQRIREDDVLVEGLASRRLTAESLKGGVVHTEEGLEGVIREPFGTRGVVSVDFQGVRIKESEPVVLERLVEEEYRFG
jgi:selenocysteine-specific elongation factor